MPPRQRVPEGAAPEPVAQRIRVQYAKRGRMRFTSTRDFQRALERAVRRAGLPMAFTAGFHPHPRISYANAAPTGTASEAEFVELALTRSVDPEEVAGALDQALPDGLTVLRVVPAAPGALADRLQASRWRLDFPGLAEGVLQQAVTALLAAERVEVSRLMKQGTRLLDVRAPLVAAQVSQVEGTARLEVTVRHTTPTIRPEEVWRALSLVGEVSLPRPLGTRLAQGPLLGTEVTDPLG